MTKKELAERVAELEQENERLLRALKLTKGKALDCLGKGSGGNANICASHAAYLWTLGEVAELKKKVGRLEARERSR